MFRVIDRPTFTRVVKISTPGDNNHRTESLKCVFRVLPTAVAAGYDLADGEQVKLFLQDIIVHMDDLVSEAGEKIEYNEGVRDQVIGLPYVRAALARAYFDAVAGERLGN